jgi:hypothetical protein
MKNFTRALSILTLICSSCWLYAEGKSSFPGIEALMTADEYKASGVGKLSPAEREALNRWLIRYTAEDSEVLRNTDEEVIEATYEQETVSTLRPPFKGWSGETMFKLENGQVWQQRRRGNYAYTGAAGPEVRITKNFMGFYRMELLESGKSVQVKRVR